MARTLLSLGLLQRPWEDRKNPRYRGIGMLDVEDYDPGRWKPLSQMYTPVKEADRFDKFWGAKLIMKLRREHIAAAVESAKLSDPRAAAWLVDALVARQHKTAKYWFDRVNPLDEVGIAGGALCFKDLAIAYRFAAPRDTSYTLTFFDGNGDRLGNVRVRARDGGATCSALRLSGGHQSYTVVRIDTARPGFKGTTYVHVAREPRTLAARVIGIWRR